MFQSTHPRGVRPEPFTQSLKKELFQSTHPRGVRHSGKGLVQGLLDVSIHAPAWGATNLPNHPREDDRVSIHAPAWGATSTAFLSLLKNNCFNPRTRVGCDESFTQVHGVPDAFQSTHPRGVRLKAFWMYPRLKMFQSTHPRGVRPTRIATMNTEAMFQSTHPRGVRLQHIGQQEVYTKVSIHAPAWGATPARGYPGARPAPFQSTHPRGVRRGKNAISGRSRDSFNPRTRVGCDAKRTNRERAEQQVSIHAPAWGATCVALLSSIIRRCFNPRTRVGCDS